jgi:proteasome lid subunit RPN8/RPN11
MRLERVRTIFVDPDVVALTLRVLQHFGSYGCEGLVLWVGKLGNEEAHVTRAFVPDQQPMKSEEGVGYFVDSTALFELNRSLVETDLRLIAQVHSHPGEAYHSEADDRYAIVTADGGLSLVVPNFGKAAPDPSTWAVYRLHNQRWDELEARELRSLLKIEGAI